MKSIFSVKKVSLNLQIYFRVAIVYFKRLPSLILAFIFNLPKNLKKEGSKIKISRRRFELSSIWPHLGIAILLCSVISPTVFAQDAGFQNSEFTQGVIEPSEYADFATSSDPYTPFINEEENETIIALSAAETVVASDESYILAPAELATEKTPQESTKPSTRTNYLSHQVLGGETLTHIGAKFDVSALSVLRANPDIKDANVLQPGKSILIPPRDGMTIIVEKGQSLDSLVKKYSGDFNQTLVANNITDPATIFSGQRILIAGGTPPKAPAPTQLAKKSSGKVKGTKSSPTGPTVPSGTFIWPTQGNVCNTKHRGYYAIDICAGGSSPAIVASDGGAVVEARFGWNGGYGNTVLIDHGNGFQTRYAHMRSLTVSAGQSVSQGQQVGWMGTTGNSTGPHLHFEIRIGGIRVNPLAYL